MRVIYNSCTDPFFNLAAEEILLAEGQGDIFMIWRNEKSVIVGKNQNTYGEIDRDFCEKNSVKVVRRLTGGGAVFHDLGNVNFSFFTDCNTDSEMDFLPYISEVTKALSSFGIDAYKNGRNDIEADGYKISGNAQCRYNCKDGRVRLLHHGTLLFSADISTLSGALRPKAEKMESKGIKSVRARVKNINDMEGYCGPADAKGFAEALCGIMADGEVGSLTDRETELIKDLSSNKYSRWEWNYGESPRFSSTVLRRFPFGTVEISYTAKKGIVEEIRIQGDFFAEGDIEDLETCLVGTTLEKEDLEKAFASVHKYIHGASCEDIINMFC